MPYQEAGHYVDEPETKKSEVMDMSLQKLLRLRHGSPEFYQLLEEMARTHDRKSHDYASNDSPFGNYLFAGSIAHLFRHSPNDMGFVGRIAEKLYRLANLEGSNKEVLNEDIEDTEKDIVVIATLWMVERRQRRKKDKI